MRELPRRHCVCPWFLALTSVFCCALNGETPSVSEHDVYQRLDRAALARLTGPVSVAFAWRSSTDHYAVQLLRGDTRIVKTCRGKATVLATGPSLAAAGEAEKEATLAIKRRLAFIDVEADGRLVARAHDDGWYDGQVGRSSSHGGIFLGELRKQRVADFGFGEDFDSPESVAGLWTTVSGSWGIEAPKDGLIARDGGPPMFSRYRAKGSALTVAGHPFWDNYRAEVRCKLTKGAGVGMVFNYRDAANHALLALVPGQGDRPGRLELRRVGDSKAQVVAAHEGAYECGRWYRLAVESHRGVVRASVNGVLRISAHVAFPLGGKVGLWTGEAQSAYFDDVEVRSTRRFSADFRSPCLKPVAGKWRTTKRRLLGQPGRPFAAALAFGPSWPNCRVTADVMPGKKGTAGLMFQWQDAANFRCLRVRGDRRAWLLSATRGGKTEIVSQGAMRKSSGGRPIRLSVETRDGMIRCSVAGRQVAKTYDLTASGGRIGLVCRGDRAEFRAFEAETLAASTSPIFATVFDAPFVPGEVDKRDRMLIGEILRPSNGIWTLAERDSGLRLSATAHQGAASCWFRDPVPGDTHVSAQIADASAGTTAGVAIDGVLRQDTGQVTRTGYSLQIAFGGNARRAELLRNGTVVARAEIAPRAMPIDLRLVRDGRFVIGSINGKSSLAYEDPSPLRGYRVGMLVGTGTAEFGRFTIGSASALSYSFEHIEPDWHAVSGRWALHGGMTCIPWAHWITGRADETPKSEALMWNERAFEGDTALAFHVSESTEGYETGEHLHFPYHDILAVLCGDGDDPMSGYACIVCGNGGSLTQILRKGKPVAQTDEYSITMGKHCNSPRAMRARFVKSGNRVQLWLENVLVLEYEDPHPIAGGRVALGLRGCRANFRDVFVFGRQP